MHWIAPSEKDAASASLEKRLWDAADQFRANSGLKAQEYSGPILGLIFLRFAEVRFATQRAKLEKVGASSRRGSRIDEPAAYHADNVLYLAPEARFDYLLTLPEAADIGGKVNAAMREVEKHNPQLAGVLPKTFNLFTGTLLKELLKKISEIPATLDFDAFGRIYEYFLGEFAMSEGQGGGEFYTPASIVQLLVQVIEPYHGRILDPACGSGGMFVQSARFVAEHHKNPAAELAICGVEKTDETGRLARLNLAVHGLEGDIRHGGNVNSYYDDPFDACGTSIEPSPRPIGHPSPSGRGDGVLPSPSTSTTLTSGHPSPSGRGDGGEGARGQTGRFDFVLANPPFNVNAVDKERLKDMVGAGRRFPFGLPRTDNANYLWIQLFYSALNEKGRAGFVMANSASDARSSEQELRQKLIEARAVDVMVAVGPNMFYTVTLPCTLWFLDKSKATPSPQPSPSGRGRNAAEGEGKQDRANTVLFIDARHIYRQVDRAHRDWTQAQIGFIANLVRLYRGEAPDLTVGGEETAAKLKEVFGHPSTSGRGAGGEGAGKVAYRDIPGLCKAATLTEIEAQGWSLNPGRYVGVAPGEEVSDEDFKEQLETLNEELEKLNAQARELEQTIAKNVAEILGT
jgi:type I restriction enzyme M protein